jgi:hypothetical protein
MWPFYFIFFAICFLAFVDTKPHKTTYLFLFGLLVVFAGFRGNIGNDYEMYIAIYNDTVGNKFLVEPSFLTIANIVNYLFDNVIYVFIIYAILGVGVTLLAIKKISEFQLFSILIYFSYFFLLHEMTQIRAGVATGFFLLSIPAIKNQKLIQFLVLIGIGTFFHYSLLIVLPFYFLGTKKINFWFYLLIPFAYILYYTHTSITSLVQFISYEHIATKFELYENTRGEQINVFNSILLLKIFIIGIFLWKHKYLQSTNEYSVLFIKLSILSTFFFVALADIPAFGFRISDIFGIIDCLMLPFLIYLFKNRLVGKLLVVFIALINISILLFYVKLFDPYF